VNCAFLLPFSTNIQEAHDNNLKKKMKFSLLQPKKCNWLFLPTRFCNLNMLNTYSMHSVRLPVPLISIYFTQLRKSRMNYWPNLYISWWFQVQGQVAWSFCCSCISCSQYKMKVMKLELQRRRQNRITNCYSLETKVLDTVNAYNATYFPWPFTWILCFLILFTKKNVIM